MKDHDASTPSKQITDQEQLIRKQLMVIDAGKELGSEIELDTLLSLIADKATKIVDADRSSVWIVDETKNELYTTVATGISGRLTGAIGQGIAGTVASTGETINIRDAYEDGRFDPSFDRSTGYHTSSILTVPMKNMRGHVTGVVQVLNKLHGSSFSSIDEELLGSLAGHAAIAVENAQLYFDLQDSYRQMLLAMTSLLELRDQETENHSIRVVEFSMRIAKEMGITDADQLNSLRLGATLHDIGKIGVSDTILLKPDRLTLDEREKMEKHTLYGHQVLKNIRNIPYIETAAGIVLHHHENYDGTGYPTGLKGQNIPLGARIFRVADVLDALASIRPYKPPWAYAEIRDYFVTHSGLWFDPVVVEAFLRVPEQAWEDIRAKVAEMFMSGHST